MPSVRRSQPAPPRQRIHPGSVARSPRRGSLRLQVHQALKLRLAAAGTSGGRGPGGFQSCRLVAVRDKRARRNSVPHLHRFRPQNHQMGLTFSLKRWPSTGYQRQLQGGCCASQPFAHERRASGCRLVLVFLLEEGLGFTQVTSLQLLLLVLEDGHGCFFHAQGSQTSGINISAGRQATILFLCPRDSRPGG